MGNHLPAGVVLEDGGAHQEKRQGIWLREIEKVLKRYDMSLEWLMGRIAARDDVMEAIRQNTEIEEGEKNALLGAKRTKGIAGVLEEVAVVIDIHFDELSETKSSTFLKRVVDNQRLILHSSRRHGQL